MSPRPHSRAWRMRKWTSTIASAREIADLRRKSLVSLGVGLAMMVLMSERRRAGRADRRCAGERSGAVRPGEKVPMDGVVTEGRSALEQTRRITAIVLDKTGTLTRGSPLSPRSSSPMGWRSSVSLAPRRERISIQYPNNTNVTSIAAASKNVSPPIKVIRTLNT